MARKLIEKITSSRTLLIIISCLAAIVLWLYVESVENIDADRTISGIPLNYLGEADILADRQLIVMNKDAQTVDITLYGKRRDVYAINREDISVTVDLTDIRSTGTVDRVYDVTFSSDVNANDIYILNKNPTYVTVEIDRMSSRQIDIRSESNITVAENFMAEPLQFSPSQITVSGPEEVISRIDHAQVLVERENLNKTVTSTLDYKLVDEDGAEVVSNELSVSTEKVEVTIPVVMYKDVVLRAELIEGGGATESDAVVKIEPATVTLSGDAELLSGLNQISLTSIDLASFEESTSGTYSIPIPNGLTNLSGVTEATVSVSLKNLAIKRIMASNIEFINVSEGYQATKVSQYLEVRVRGPQAIVDLINAYSIRVVGDLSQYGQAAGRYAVDVKVYIDGYSDAGVVGDYTVVVSLEEKAEEPPPPEVTEPEPGEEEEEP